MSQSEFRTVEKLTNKPSQETVIDLPENSAQISPATNSNIATNTGNHPGELSSQVPADGSIAAFQTISSFYHNERGKHRGTLLVQTFLFFVSFFIFTANFHQYSTFFGGPEPNPPFAITITIMALFLAISAYLKSTASRAESKIKSSLGHIRPTAPLYDPAGRSEHYAKNAAQYVVTFSKINSTLRLLQHSLIYALTVLSAIWAVFAIQVPESRFESLAFAITCLSVAGIIQLILRMDFFGYDEDVKKLLCTIENDSKFAAVLHWAKIPPEDHDQRKVAQISHAEFEELPRAVSLNFPRLVLMYGLASFFTGILNMVFAERFLSQPISDVFVLTVITSVLSLPLIVSSYKRLRFPTELRQRYILNNRVLLAVLLVIGLLLFCLPVIAMSEVLRTQYKVEPPVGLLLIQVGLTLIIPVSLSALESTRFAHAANKILCGRLSPYTSFVTLPWRADRPIPLTTIPMRFAQDILDIKRQLNHHIIDKEATMRPLMS
ncbi:MAG: hypothetical protein Q4A92_08300 [Corynebacterium sp.]|nr:hypothetical protein [Corynebacterium sp.]